MKLLKGTIVSICHFDDPDRRWKKHTMKKTIDVTTHRTPKVFGSSGAVIFKVDKWLILTKENPKDRKFRRPKQ
jgi:hypothetical protein